MGNLLWNVSDIDERIAELDRIIKAARKRLAKAPKGRLRTKVERGHVRYYVVYHPKDTTGVYLRPEKEQLARALAQKAYDEKVVRAAEKEKKALLAIRKNLPEQCCEEVYERLTDVRKEMVTPIEEPDDVFVQTWLSQLYDKDWFKESEPKFQTDRGDLVRSKSEALEANKIYRMEIPYLYERPLDLMVDGRRRTRHPDFTLLDVVNRREIILEHFGMMDNQDYANSALRKIQIYEENGYFEGENIIYMFESSEVPLDLDLLERKLRHVLDGC